MTELLTAIFLFLKTGEKFATQDVAGPTVAAFTDHLGQAVHAKFDARVLNDPQPAIELCSKQNVAVGIVTPGFYLTYAKALGIEPLLEVRRAGVAEERYVLVAGKEASAKPEEWAGKSIATTLAPEKRYVMGVILQAKFGEEVRLQPTADLEDAVFRVAEHAAKAPDGVLLEEAAWKLYADDPDLGSKLKVVYRSEPVPGPLLVKFSPKAGGLDFDKLKSTLLSLNQTEDGKRLLASIQVASFALIDEARLKAAKEKFNGP